MNKLIEKIILIGFIIGMFSYGSAYAFLSEDDVSTTGAQFLKLEAGGRGPSMGGAQTGVTNNVEAVYWNPAGLNSIDSKQASLMYCKWLENIYYGHLAYAQPVGKGAIGTSLKYLSMSSIQKYDNEGNKLAGETFTPSDYSFQVSYARKYMDADLGVSLKFISCVLEVEKANAVSMDLGGIKYFLERKLSVGVAVKNIGTQIKFIDKGYSLPFSLRVGAGYRLTVLKNELLIATDMDLPGDNVPGLSVGAEYLYMVNKFLKLIPRLGYRTNIKGLDGLAGVSGGFGLKYRDINLDYAWIPYGDLGNTHRVSINLNIDSLLKIQNP